MALYYPLYSLVNDSMHHLLFSKPNTAGHLDSFRILLSQKLSGEHYYTSVLAIYHLLPRAHFSGLILKIPQPWPYTDASFQKQILVFQGLLPERSVAFIPGVLMAGQ